MSFHARRLVVLVLLLVSIGLLVPGILAPVLTIKGVLKPEGVAHVAPELLEKGLSDESVANMKAMLNPNLVGLVEGMGGDLRKMILERLGPQMTASLEKNATDVEVYEQTRSIVSSVQHLYEVKSPIAATLILIFSVFVPFSKAAMIFAALFVVGEELRRERMLRFVEAIAKWSMADVFVVALFIAFLAAQASQTPPDDPDLPPPLLAFTADFGPGFYWFAGYCLFSLAAQQVTAGWFSRKNAQEA